MGNSESGRTPNESSPYSRMGGLGTRNAPASGNPFGWFVEISEPGARAGALGGRWRFDVLQRSLYWSLGGFGSGSIVGRVREWHHRNSPCLHQRTSIVTELLVRSRYDRCSGIANPAAIPGGNWKLT